MPFVTKGPTNTLSEDRICWWILQHQPDWCNYTSKAKDTSPVLWCHFLKSMQKQVMLSFGAKRQGDAQMDTEGWTMQAFNMSSISESKNFHFSGLTRKKRCFISFVPQCHVPARVQEGMSPSSMGHLPMSWANSVCCGSDKCPTTLFRPASISECLSLLVKNVEVWFDRPSSHNGSQSDNSCTLLTYTGWALLAGAVHSCGTQAWKALSRFTWHSRWFLQHTGVAMR